MKNLLKKLEKKKITNQSLNKWNKVLAVLHAVQGVAVLLLAKAVTFPVTTSYLTLNPVSSSQEGPQLIDATRNVLDINVAYLVAAFFFMSAIAHLVIATMYRDTYEKNLKKGLNKARWIEYAISASTMIVAIGLLSGVYDMSSLLMFFVLTAVMNLLGLVMEVHNQTTKKTNWLSFWIGTLAGIVPWVVLGIYFWGTNTYGSGQIPTFVYAIYVSLFVFFSCFAVNMWLQYKKVGPWKNYLFGEKTYMVLSLVAKSALAWQVFFGALRP